MEVGLSWKTVCWLSLIKSPKILSAAKSDAPVGMQQRDGYDAFAEPTLNVFNLRSLALRTGAERLIPSTRQGVFRRKWIGASRLAAATNYGK